MTSRICWSIIPCAIRMCRRASGAASTSTRTPSIWNATLTIFVALSRARGTGPDLRGALGRPGAICKAYGLTEEDATMMDDPPVDRQLRGLSETRQQFREY